MPTVLLNLTRMNKTKVDLGEPLRSQLSFWLDRPPPSKLDNKLYSSLDLFLCRPLYSQLRFGLAAQLFSQFQSQLNQDD